MKTLLIILALLTTQLFALGIYDNEHPFQTNCIFQQEQNTPVFFAISTSEKRGIKQGIFSVLSINTKLCDFFANGYSNFYKNKYQTNMPQLLTNPDQAAVGFIPVFYHYQIKPKNSDIIDDYSCSGSLFRLEKSDALLILTAKHCIEPLDVKAYNNSKDRSLLIVKDGLNGAKFKNINIENINIFKPDSNIDAATITIKNAALSLKAKKATIGFEELQSQLTPEFEKVFYNMNPIQLFFFGGGSFYSKFDKKRVSYDEHAVSAAYLFANSAQLIFKSASKKIKTMADLNAKINENNQRLNTKINDNKQLLFCKGDSGGAVVKFNPGDNKYLFLGILIAGGVNDASNECSSAPIFIPISRFLQN